MKSIEFDFDTQDGRTVTIFGEIDNGEIYFTAEKDGIKVPKKSLNSRDLNLINALIEDNAPDLEDDEFEMGYYD